MGKYKLGGFLPIVTWLPLLKIEPPSSLPYYPVNQHTPIFHMNGMMDLIVPLVPAGLQTKHAMNEVFTNYTFRAIPGTTHATTAPNPLTMPILKSWLKKNTNLKFKGGLSGALSSGLSDGIEVVESLFDESGLSDGIDVVESLLNGFSGFWRRRK